MNGVIRGGAYRGGTGMIRERCGFRFSYKKGDTAGNIGFRPVNGVFMGGASSGISYWSRCSFRDQFYGRGVSQGGLGFRSV